VEKLNDNVPEWTSFAKFPLPDASIMPRQIFPRVVHGGQIWHFRDLNGAGGVAETETCKSEILSRQLTPFLMCQLFSEGFTYH
jgi:hypothetical protein